MQVPICKPFFAIAKKNGFAIPAVNVVGSSTVNAVLESAKVANAPVIIQFSNGGAIYNAGKGLKLRVSKPLFWEL